MRDEREGSRRSHDDVVAHQSEMLGTYSPGVQAPVLLLLLSFSPAQSGVLLRHGVALHLARLRGPHPLPGHVGHGGDDHDDGDDDDDNVMMMMM